MPSMIPDLAVRAAKSLPNSVMNEEMGANVPESKIEKKALVLIILVIVFKHKIKI